EARSSDRYYFHDLLREYARGLVTGTVPEADRHNALTRLFDYYLHAAAAATEHYEIGDIRVGLDLDDSTVTIPSHVSVEQTRSWLDAEWQNTIATVHLAHGLGWDRIAWQLTRAIWAYLWYRGHNGESAEIHERAVKAAARLGDRAMEAAALNYLASA